MPPTVSKGLKVCSLLVMLLGGCDRVSEHCGTAGDPEVPIGGAFQLTDHSGQTATNDSYAGRYRIVYFGFTFCPDICPTELQSISTALDMLGERAAKIQPLFITIDPDRDDVEAMAAYLGHFHPSFIGLTGTPAEIEQVAHAYKIYYAKAQSSEEADDYTMNHSSFIYVMDCEGRYIRHLSQGASPEEIAGALRELD